jgi:hypothetical protein
MTDKAPSALEGPKRRGPPRFSGGVGLRSSARLEQLIDDSYQMVTYIVLKGSLNSHDLDKAKTTPIMGHLPQHSD